MVLTSELEMNLDDQWESLFRNYLIKVDMASARLLRHANSDCY